MSDLPHCDEHPHADVIITVTSRFRVSVPDGRLMPIDETWLAWCGFGHDMREGQDD